MYYMCLIWNLNQRGDLKGKETFLLALKRVVNFAKEAKDKEISKSLRVILFLFVPLSFSVDLIEFV